jgi:hypothetical protein
MIQKLLQDRVWLLTDIINIANIDIKLGGDAETLTTEILKYKAERHALQMIIGSLHAPNFAAELDMGLMVVKALCKGYKTRIEQGVTEYVPKLMQVEVELTTMLWVRELLNSQSQIVA